MDLEMELVRDRVYPALGAEDSDQRGAVIIRGYERLLDVQGDTS
jgi:hypothetical protein